MMSNGLQSTQEYACQRRLSRLVLLLGELHLHHARWRQLDQDKIVLVFRARKVASFHSGFKYQYFPSCGILPRRLMMITVNCKVEMPEGPVGDRHQRQLDSIPKMRVQLPKVGLNFRVAGARQPQVDRDKIASVFPK